MTEERSLKRRHLIYYLKIIDASNEKVLGHLGDITTEGLMILSEDEIPSNRNYILKIKLPETEELPKSHIDVSVITRWVRPDQNPNIKCIGCQITDLGPEDRLIITHLIRILGFND